MFMVGKESNYERQYPSNLRIQCNPNHEIRLNTQFRFVHGVQNPQITKQSWRRRMELEKFDVTYKNTVRHSNIAGTRLERNTRSDGTNKCAMDPYLRQRKAKYNGLRQSLQQVVKTGTRKRTRALIAIRKQMIKKWDRNIENWKNIGKLLSRTYGSLYLW